MNKSGARKLELHKDTIRVLEDSALRGVAGGSDPLSPVYPDPNINPQSRIATTCGHVISYSCSDTCP